MYIYLPYLLLASKVVKEVATTCSALWISYEQHLNAYLGTQLLLFSPSLTL